MKITQDVRDYAATLNDPAGVGSLLPHPEAAAQGPSKEEAERGMQEMSKKFLDMGAKVYVEAEKVKEANKALE